MMRIVCTAVWASVAAASLSHDCLLGLASLRGDSDVELAARCRAAFAPEVCKQVGQSLGAQPWTAARMKESCSRFEVAFDGLDGRTLEEAVLQKAPAPAAEGDMRASLDASTQGKVKEPAEAPEQTPESEEGPVAKLLKKLKESKKAEGAEAMLDEAKEAASDASKEEQKEKAEAVATKAEEKAGEQIAKAEDAENDPLKALFNKIKSEKDVAEKRLRLKRLRLKKLYEETELEQPTSRSKMARALGALSVAASIAGVTLLVVSRRRPMQLASVSLTEPSTE